MIVIYSEKRKPKYLLLEWGITLVVNAVVLLMASNIFQRFEIKSFWYALLAALVIMVLNKTIKPLMTLLTLPLTILTLGLFYPFINVFILKIASWLIGDAFIVEGWFVAFFIAIFISFMTIILDVLITKRIMRGVR
jgi:putative membrane protein